MSDVINIKASHAGRPATFVWGIKMTYNGAIAGFVDSVFDDADDALTALNDVKKGIPDYFHVEIVKMSRLLGKK